MVQNQLPSGGQLEARERLREEGLENQRGRNVGGLSILSLKSDIKELQLWCESGNKVGK